MGQTDQKISYEAALARVDEISALLSGNAVSLEDSVKLYAEGSALLVRAQGLLDEAQLELETLSPDEFKLDDPKGGEGE